MLCDVPLYTEAFGKEITTETQNTRNIKYLATDSTDEHGLEFYKSVLSVAFLEFREFRGSVLFLQELVAADFFDFLAGLADLFEAVQQLGIEA